MIRVAVADDHAIVRRGIVSLISLSEDLKLEAEFSSGTEFLQSMDTIAPDILVTDLSMPGLKGCEFIGRVRKSRPALPILVFSLSDEPEIAESALRSGASGFVTKDSDPEMLLAAIRHCAAGKGFIQPVMAARMVNRQLVEKLPPAHEILSRRELQIMTLLASGTTINTIANKLFLSPKTVSTHKFRIMQKMGFRTIADMVKYAIQHELTED